MDLKIFKERDAIEEDIYFKLEKSGDDICLVATNMYGGTITRGNILRISKEGVKLSRSVGIKGIKTDNIGRIVVIEN